MSEKRCTKCGESKPFAAFAKDSRRPSGLASQCRACRAERLVLEPTVTEKHCPRCDTTKDASLFHTNKNRYDGLVAYCKACTSVRSKEVHAAKRDTRNAQTKAWRERNPGYFRRYYARNREAMQAKARLKRLRKVETPEQREKRLAYQRAYYQKNREKELRKARERTERRRNSVTIESLPAWMRPRRKPAVVPVDVRGQNLMEAA